ncbi:hypothetical protein ACFWAR_26335 [Streptomyces sp. NPDC059917]|uniref:Mu transposase domain-containing protein n=1 Tax=Streptomyces sp. NPDC059917 TaxID=3347002 RepID=UPI0036511861
MEFERAEEGWRIGMIAVRVCRYSVPARFIGRTVRVVLRSSDLVVCNGRTEIAGHPRLTAKGAHRATRLPADRRPLPTLERWDQLLNQSRKASP